MVSLKQVLAVGLLVETTFLCVMCVIDKLWVPETEASSSRGNQGHHCTHGSRILCLSTERSQHIGRLGWGKTYHYCYYPPFTVAIASNKRHTQYCWSIRLLVHDHGPKIDLLDLQQFEKVLQVFMPQHGINFDVFRHLVHHDKTICSKSVGSPKG